MAIGIVDHTLTVAWKWGLSTVAALREDIRKGVEGDEGLPAATVPDRLDGNTAVMNVVLAPAEAQGI